MRIQWDNIIRMGDGTEYKVSGIIENAAEAYRLTSYAFRKKMTFNNYLESVKSSTAIELRKDTIHSIRI